MGEGGVRHMWGPHVSKAKNVFLNPGCTWGNNSETMLSIYPYMLYPKVKDWKCSYRRNLLLLLPRPSLRTPASIPPVPAKTTIPLRHTHRAVTRHTEAYLL